MLFCLFGILVIHWMEDVSATSPSSSSSYSRIWHRDYANKIGMVCCYNKTGNGSLYMELGENDRIGDKLEPFGRNRNVIFYIIGYSADLNPDDNGETLAKIISETKAWIKDENTVVCKFDYFHPEEVGTCCAMFPKYRKHVKTRIPFAAKIINSVFAEMYQKVFDSFENFDLVGFSLGAHVAGYTAKLIKFQFGEIIPRIFALDPSLTIVYNNRKNELEKTDAKYVQAIITSSISREIDAHCKVIINDGSIQPGCETLPPIVRTICSHRYVARLYHHIASGKKLYAFTMTNAENGMMVGHLSRENPIGVFHAKTNFK